MIGRTKEDWQRFKAGKPGHRFQDRYHHRQQERGHLPKRIFLICLGAVLALGSLFLAPLPGPGFATVFLGLAILAGEVLPAARFLDWAEVAAEEVRAVRRAGLAGVDAGEGIGRLGSRDLRRRASLRDLLVAFRRLSGARPYFC